jgi:hypothetical protein
MSEHPAELVCSRLGDVHPKSGGGYTAKCPAHEDDHESLSIDEGDDGRALLKCFAGCDIQAIVKGLGLTTKDLFERRNGGGGGCHSPLPEDSNTRTPRQEINQSKNVDTVLEDRTVEVFESDSSNSPPWLDPASLR